jgi:SAM-dependent methyltransferase
VALEIVPVDPLAAAYATLLARHDRVPPLATRFAPAEDLCLYLPPGSFDLAHCRNALDHSWEPLRGIEQMLAMVRVGGRVLLRHFADEAEREAYSGFHQFNFSNRDGRFIIWNATAEIDVAAALATPARVSVAGDAFVTVTIEKTGPSPEPSPAEAEARLAAAMEALIAALAAAQLPA